MKILVVLGAIFFLGIGSGFPNSTKYISNYDFLKKTTCETFRPLFKALGFNTHHTIIIKHHPADSLQVWFVDGCLIETLQEAGFNNIFIDPAKVKKNNKENVYKVFYKIIELSLNYRSKSNWSFTEAKMLNRTVVTHFQIQIFENDKGKLIWSNELRQEARDQIPTWVAKEFQSNALPIAIPRVPSTSLLKRFIEPALVLSISGGIIYSFYALRSN